MPSETPQPHIFENPDIWIKQINREWQFRPPADLHGTIDPPVVEAASGHTLVVTLTLGPNLTLPTGAHITMEVPATWDAHLGNCFRRGVRTVGNREQVRAGYGAWTDVECSNLGVHLELAASWGRILDLVDVVVTEGQLVPGDEVRLILGPPDGNLIQAQKHAQVAIFTVGIDLAGDRQYRRAATHPTVRVVGAYADHLRVFAPSVVEPGETFPVRVLPVDIYSRNPATDYRGHVAFHAGKNVIMPSEIEVDTNVQLRAASTTAAIACPGVQTITVLDPATGVSGQSGPIVCKSQPERHIYFGEMHSQMWHSMGTGTTAEFFEWGRDAAGLDFCAPANHYNWRFELTEEIWREMVDTCNTYNDPERFVTLVSYEWGGGGGSGHKNVYYRGAEGEFETWYRGRTSPDLLWERLGQREALTVPHHTRAFGGVDWSYRNDHFQRLVEICSNWGISEAGGGHSVQAALAMGHRLGFVGGTDSHYGLANQGSYHVDDGNGLACVAASDLTRDAIWQALYERRCYATTGDRIVLDFAMEVAPSGCQPMGTDLPVNLAEVEPRTFRARVAGTYRIDDIEILRNNEVVYLAHPGKKVWEGEWTDDQPLAPIALAPTFSYDRPFVFYYLRVRQGNRHRAWASPIWLTQRAL